MQTAFYVISTSSRMNWTDYDVAVARNLNVKSAHWKFFVMPCYLYLCFEAIVHTFVSGLWFSYCWVSVSWLTQVAWSWGGSITMNCQKSSWSSLIRISLKPDTRFQPQKMFQSCCLSKLMEKRWTSIYTNRKWWIKLRLSLSWVDLIHKMRGHFMLMGTSKDFWKVNVTTSLAQFLKLPDDE